MDCRIILATLIQMIMKSRIRISFIQIRIKFNPDKLYQDLFQLGPDPNQLYPDPDQLDLDPRFYDHPDQCSQNDPDLFQHPWFLSVWRIKNILIRIRLRPIKLFGSGSKSEKANKTFNKFKCCSLTICV